MIYKIGNGNGVKALKKIPFKEIGNSIKNGIDNFVSKFSKKGIQ